MVSYKLEILRSASRDVRKIDKRYIASILDSIKSLSENPFPSQCKKLSGKHNLADLVSRIPEDYQTDEID